MGYMHIDNLYKNQEILLFKECYALEKIHGTSAHIKWRENRLIFHVLGFNHKMFVKMFNPEVLENRFMQMGREEVIIFGEVYGGKVQGMSRTYGKESRFVAFESKIDDMWLNVPGAEQVAKDFDIDFVPYVRCSTDIEVLNAERDKPSEQAVKCGILEPRPREGVVLRPLIELKKNNDKRIISKHKGDAFKETRTKREVNPEKLAVLENANAIAEEWVTDMRLTHVLQNFKEVPGFDQLGDIIMAMVEDIEREAEGEIVKSKEARRAIGRNTAILFKKRLKFKEN